MDKCQFCNRFILTYRAGRLQAKLPKQMRTFDESLKSKKTVASMIERKGDKDAPPKKTVKIVEAKKDEFTDEETNGLSEDQILANRRKLVEKLQVKKKGDTKLVDSIENAPLADE